MITEKCKRQNDMLSHGLLRYVIEGSSPKTTKESGGTRAGWGTLVLRSENDCPRRTSPPRAGDDIHHQSSR